MWHQWPFRCFPCSEVKENAMNPSANPLVFPRNNRVIIIHSVGMTKDMAWKQWRKAMFFSRNHYYSTNKTLYYHCCHSFLIWFCHELSSENQEKTSPEVQVPKIPQVMTGRKYFGVQNPQQLRSLRETEPWKLMGTSLDRSRTVSVVISPRKRCIYTVVSGNLT